MSYKYKEIWDINLPKNYEGCKYYDGWLEKEPIKEIIRNTSKPIIDLGCGTGNNCVHLNEIGKEVIACDYSDEGLKLINRVNPNIKTINFDMTNTFPFNDGMTDLVIADICLHYFDKETTLKILNEIRRILTNEGYFLFRVNSTKDFNHGAGQGTKLDENFYFVQGMTKRFFNEKDIKEFLADFKILLLKEEPRDLKLYDEENKKWYLSPKTVWKCLAKK